MRRLFAEGAFSQAFVPVFSQYRKEREEADLKDLVNHVAGSLGGFLLLLTLVGTLFAPALVYIFAPGFIDKPDQFQLTTNLLRVTFPYIFFIALVAFSGGILNSFNQFAVPAFTPILLNLCLIGAAYFLAPLFNQPLMALAWGVAAAGLAQLLFQFPSLLRLGMLPLPRFNRNHEGVKKTYAANAAGNFWFFCCSDQLAARHANCILSGFRQYHLVILFRPPAGIPAGCAGYCCCYGYLAGLIAATRKQFHRGI